MMTFSKNLVNKGPELHNGSQIDAIGFMVTIGFSYK